jgi:hypothetical protein
MAKLFPFHYQHLEILVEVFSQIYFVRIKNHFTFATPYQQKGRVLNGLANGFDYKKPSLLQKINLIDF